MRLNYTFILFLLFCFPILSYTQVKHNSVIDKNIESGTFVDARDNEIYMWVKIGNQIWMAENLRYAQGRYIEKKREWGRKYGKNPSQAYCWYKNDQTNKYNLGALYTYSSAKKACPDGWHLPSNDEWEELISFVGGGPSNIIPSKGTAPREIASIKLRSVTNWNFDYHTPGTDDFDFDMLPGGSRNGYFGIFEKHTENETEFWTSTIDDNGLISYKCFYGVIPWIQTFTQPIEKSSCGRSVRCLKDNTNIQSRLSISGQKFKTLKELENAPDVLKLFEESINSRSKLEELILGNYFSLEQESETCALLLGAFTMKNNIESLKYILSMGANPNSKLQGKTVLMLTDNKEIVKLLIGNKKNDVNIQDDTNGSTALMLQARAGRTEIVRILLDNGADHLIEDYEGFIAENYATGRQTREVLGTKRVLNDIQKSKQESQEPNYYFKDEESDVEINEENTITNKLTENYNSKNNNGLNSTSYGVKMIRKNIDGISVWASARITKRYIDPADGDEMVDFDVTVYAKNNGPGDYIQGCIYASFNVGSVIGCSKEYAIFSTEYHVPSNLTIFKSSLWYHYVMWYGGKTFTRTFHKKGWRASQYNSDDFLDFGIDIKRLEDDEM